MSSFRVTLRLPESWRGPVEELCKARGIEPAPPAGVAGGPSQAIRDLLGAHLDLEPVEDFHEDEKSRAKERRDRVAYLRTLSGNLQLPRERLIRARVLACLGQDELSALLGIPVERVRAIERYGRITRKETELWAEQTKKGFDWLQQPWPAEVSAQLEGLAEWVRSIRERNGLTKRGFALAVGACPSNVGRWEEGKTAPAPPNLRRIRDAFQDSQWPPDSAKESSPILL